MTKDENKTPRCCDTCGLRFNEGEKMYRCYDMLLCRDCLGDAIGYDLTDMTDEEIEELGDEFLFEVIGELDEEDFW